MDLTVALVGGLVGGTIAAIIGGIVTLQAQGRQHTHEREMARDARTQDRRATAYVRILEHTYRLDMWVTRTATKMTPAPDPPPPLPDEELNRLDALTGAYASPEVQAIVGRVWAAVRAVQVGVWRVEDERLTEAVLEARTALDVATATFRAEAQALADRINEELRA